MTLRNVVRASGSELALGALQMVLLFFIIIIIPNGCGYAALAKNQRSQFTKFHTIATTNITNNNCRDVTHARKLNTIITYVGHMYNYFKMIHMKTNSELLYRI